METELTPAQQVQKFLALKMAAILREQHPELPPLMAVELGAWLARRMLLGPYEVERFRAMPPRLPILPGQSPSQSEDSEWTSP